MKAEDFLKDYEHEQFVLLLGGRRVGRTAEIITTFAETYAKHLIESISDDEYDEEYVEPKHLDCDCGWFKIGRYSGFKWFKEKLLKTLEE